MSHTRRVYLKLVNIFYANLELHSSRALISKLKGNTIYITKDVLSEWLHAPRTGVCFYEHGSQPNNVPSFTHLKAIRMWRTNCVNTESRIKAHDLPLDYKILYHVIRTNALLASRAFSQVIIMETLILWHIAEKRPVKLPNLVFERMKKSKSKPTTIPYCSLLSHAIEKLLEPEVLKKEEVLGVHPSYAYDHGLIKI